MLMYSVKILEFCSLNHMTINSKGKITGSHICTEPSFSRLEASDRLLRGSFWQPRPWLFVYICFQCRTVWGHAECTGGAPRLIPL